MGSQAPAILLSDFEACNLERPAYAQVRFSSLRQTSIS